MFQAAQDVSAVGTDMSVLAFAQAWAYSAGYAVFPIVGVRDPSCLRRVLSVLGALHRIVSSGKAGGFACSGQIQYL